MAADDLPEGWTIYARETAEGEHWTGEYYGPNGFSTRLGDATKEGLIAKVKARTEYRTAAGFVDPSPVALRSTP